MAERISTGNVPASHNFNELEETPKSQANESKQRKLFSSIGSLDRQVISLRIQEHRISSLASWRIAHADELVFFESRKFARFHSEASLEKVCFYGAKSEKIAAGST
jgi:hypothetical protein